jgi:hypothetical protein
MASGKDQPYARGPRSPTAKPTSVTLREGDRYAAVCRGASAWGAKALRRLPNRENENKDVPRLHTITQTVANTVNSVRQWKR